MSARQDATGPQPCWSCEGTGIVPVRVPVTRDMELDAEIEPGTGGYFTQGERCMECGGSGEDKEAPDGTDSPASGDSRGAAVPVAEPGCIVTRTLPELLAELSASLDEPLVAFGGRTTREMLAARMRGEGT